MSSPAWRGHAWPGWVTLVCRVVLGGVIFVAGALKVTDLEGSARAVRAYQILPWELSGYVGYALPVVEMVIGALLVVGLFTRVMAALGALMMLVYIGAIISVWARGLSIDCGCFSGGGAKESVSPVTYALDILRDLGLFLLGAWATWRPRSPLALERALFGDPIIIDEE